MYRSMLVKGLDGLLSGDRKLALLRAAEVVLELREHVTHTRLRGINREAAFARAPVTSNSVPSAKIVLCASLPSCANDRSRP